MDDDHKTGFFYGAVILFTLYCSSFFAQNNMLVAHDELHQMPVSFEKTTNKPNCYIQQGLYHLSELQFFGDSSFVYYFVSNVRYNITFGHYTQVDNLITLNWDSVATVLLAADSGNYKKYFKFKFPIPFKIENKFYLVRSNSLENIKVKFPTKKTELYFSSNDILKNGFVIDSFFQIKYNPAGTKLVLQRNKQKDVLFPKDSIWGYKTCPDNWKCELYRIAPKGTNWYSSAGIQVVQIDALIIYTIGSDFLNTYFSKDLNSTIYHLNNSGITKAFKENEPLLKWILKEMDKIQNNYTAINEKTDCFKIIEIYKDALK